MVLGDPFRPVTVPRLVGRILECSGHSRDATVAITAATNGRLQCIRLAIVIVFDGY